MSSPKKILLTGSSGTVGMEVLKQLVHSNKNYDITVFDIENSRTKKMFRSYQDVVKIQYGDIRNAEQVLEVCKGQDVVIHLAALIPPVADDKPELAYDINVNGTKHIVNALTSVSPNAFLLYSSSVSVYGDRLHTPMIKVTDNLQSSEGDAYGNTKIEAEKIIKESNLNWCIFRLSAIMGNHKMSKLMFHMPLETEMEIATPSDTARAFVKAIDHLPALNHNIYNLSGGEACRIVYQDFLNRSFNIFGLGNADFPYKSFAEKNFHCAYIADSDALEHILHFRKDNLEDYFNTVRSNTPAIQKWITSLFKNPIKRKLLHQSEPYEAYIKQNKEQLNRFFH